MTRRWSAAVLLVLVSATGGCCENASVDEENSLALANSPMPVHRLTDAKPADLDRYLRAASLVFVGRLLSADFRWYPGAGVAAISASMRWAKLRTLRGHDWGCRIEVLGLMVGRDFPMEESAYGYRLSPRYLLLGRDYVVAARKASLSGPPDNPVGRLLFSLNSWLFHREPEQYYVGGDGLEVWPATPENVSGIEARLAGMKP